MLSESEVMVFLKIGIVTIVDYTNYGNRLQNYAVYYVLKEKYRCKAITLAAHEEKPFCDGNYIAWCKESIAKFLGCIMPSAAEKRFGNHITRWVNFCRWSRRIPTKHYYGSEKLPEHLNSQYDFFFVGSDQIWNYHFVYREFYNYFLKFTDSRKKAAISGSFGVEEIPEKWKETYKEGLSGFSHISVREDAGRAIVKELLGKDVPVLIDPVMMLSPEEWLKVARKPRVDCSRPYILKYYLGDEAEEDRIDVWAQKNGYEVYELLNDEIPELYSAGPGEFISLINSAALVCSDSFHCIAFSIIFSRPFIVYDRRGKDTDMSSRLDTLLKKFGFQNRWKQLLKEDEYLLCDYEPVKKLLQKEQKKFMDYVSAVLNEG